MRFDRPLSIVMADLDLLRDINNTYGHLAGDTVLAGIAEIMQEEVRSYDLAARFGGEEFALLLPETSLEEAAEIADRVRVKLANTRFTIPGHRRAIRATISCGIAGYPGAPSDATALIQAADEALYASKSGGRNRVAVAPAAAVEDGFAAEMAALTGKELVHS